MSDIISGILKNTIGFLWNKVRDYTARQLDDGDLTNEECRKLIVRSMVELKATLDALSRKDLLSSINFISEGATTLMSFESSTNSQETTTELAPVVKAFDQLTLCSNKHFKAAKECFKTAREEATRAFSNTSLSIEDRVLASQIRITARILESLDEPDLAGPACLLFLKQLHELPGVQEIFSVLLGGGVRSIFKKKKRQEIATSVVRINLALYRFVRKSTKLPFSICNWPTIPQTGQESYHAIIRKGESLLQGELQDLDSKELPIVYQTAHFPGYIYDVNSNGEPIMELKNKPCIAAITKNKEEIRTLFTFSDDDAKKKDFCVVNITVDKDDNMYMITSFETTDDIKQLVLFVIGKEGNIKNKRELEFLIASYHRYICIAVNLEGYTIFCASDRNTLYICDNTGNMKSSHPLPNDKCFLGGVTDTNDILVADQRENIVYILNEDGNLKKELDISKAFKFPVELRDVAFCFLTKTIVALVVKIETYSLFRYYLAFYSKEADVESRVVYLWDDAAGYLGVALGRIYSHPSGSMVVETQTKAILF